MELLVQLLDDSGGVVNLAENKHSVYITICVRTVREWMFRWGMELLVQLLDDSGGVVNSLTFARHCSNRLAAFTLMEGSDSEFADFTLPTLKAFLAARSHNVSGSKQ